MYAYMFSRASSPCDGLDDMVLMLEINEELERFLSESKSHFLNLKQSMPDLFQIETFFMPWVDAVAQEHWSQVLDAINSTGNESKVEEIYELEGWEYAEFLERPDFGFARTEAWSTVISKQGLGFNFAGKHEDRTRNSVMLDFDALAKL